MNIATILIFIFVWVLSIFIFHHVLEYKEERLKAIDESLDEDEREIYPLLKIFSWVPVVNTVLLIVAVLIWAIYKIYDWIIEHFS